MMNAFNRRQFLKLAGGATALAALPPFVRAATPAPRVVIIGGGFGGATVAKYLKLWGGNVDVTMVDANANHVSCILSSLVLTDAISLNRITLSYDSLRTQHGVSIIQDRAVTIDPVTHSVSLEVGTTLPYDHLILSPGIDFIPIPGWDPNLVPHAWQAGPQTTLLKDQIAAMPAGGSFVITIPQSPYRCPPGPYERACLVADFVRRNKPGSKVIVLDANPSIVAEEHTFSVAFNQTYANIIEYHTNVSVTQVDSANRIIDTSIGQFPASVLNVIPNQQAGQIARDADLGIDASGRWVPIDPLTYASAKHSDVHVIGDSQATGQPKSGHMASSQGKIAADAILRSFAGLGPDAAPTTNSACYSPIDATTASWLTAVFQYDPGTGSMKLVPESLGEAEAPTSENYREMFQWADNIFADSFV
jgi:NADH dehydrogenase FAD-containing subunit